MVPVAPPAKGFAARQRVTNRRIARHLGMNEVYVGRVLNGHEVASARFSKGLADLLDVPEAELFRSDDHRVGAA